MTLYGRYKKHPEETFPGVGKHQRAQDGSPSSNIKQNFKVGIQSKK